VQAAAWLPKTCFRPDAQLDAQLICTLCTHRAQLVLVVHVIDAVQLGNCQGTATGARSRLRHMGTQPLIPSLLCTLCTHRALWLSWSAEISWLYFNLYSAEVRHASPWAELHEPCLAFSLPSLPNNLSLPSLPATCPQISYGGWLAGLLTTLERARTHGSAQHQPAPSSISHRQLCMRL
jgi:hypothetical protein